MTKPILCLDFDGVLHSYTSGWKGADVVSDPVVEGAVPFLIDALKHFEVHVFSSRSNQEGGIKAMQIAINGWLLEEGYPAGMTHGIVWGTEGPCGLQGAIRFPTEKPPAMVTIDDRAITFKGLWPSIETLQAFKPWNKL